MHVSWRSLSRVVRDGCFHRVRRRANPMIHHRKCRPEWARWPTFRLSDEFMVAAGPSTCCDEFVAAHHRTTGGPGQGVDVRLPCPAINYSPATRCSSGLSRGVAVGKKYAMAAENMNSPGDDGRTTPQKAETTLVTAGRDTRAQKGFVNPPVVRGSTVLYPTADDLHAHRGEFQYGRHGTPTTKALQATLMALEGPQCAGAGLTPSGLGAISTTLLAVLKAGDHLLVCDNVYRPTRSF